MPTNISGVYSRLVTGTEAYDDTLANHISSGISNGQEFNQVKDLYGEKCFFKYYRDQVHGFTVARGDHRTTTSITFVIGQMRKLGQLTVSD